MVHINRPESGDPAASDEDFIFVKSFWHSKAKRRIYAAPGKAFRLPRRKP